MRTQSRSGVRLGTRFAFALFVGLASVAGSLTPATAQTTAKKTMTTASGLQITDTVEGTGATPTRGRGSTSSTRITARPRRWSMARSRSISRR